MATKNDIAVFNPSANVPAYARAAEPSALAKALAGGGGQSGKRISVKGGVFRLVVDGKEVTAIEDRYLDVVLVNAASKIARTYYAKTFDENNVSAPDCWSPDGNTPDKTSANLQSTSCATCKQNIKGSGQGETRACRFSQRVAVVLANDMEGDVMQLSLAATSIFGKEEGENRPLQAYARYLAAQGIDPGALVTRLKFDTTAATPKLFFKAVRWLTDEEYAICQAQGKSKDAINAVTMTVAQMDKAPEPQPIMIAGKKPTAVTQPEEPQPGPVVEEEDAPPVKRKSTAAAPAAGAKSSLAQLVNQWADSDD